MPPRKLEELAADVDDASVITEELQHEPDVDTDAKLDELQNTLEHASTTIDELENEETPRRLPTPSPSLQHDGGRRE